MGWYNLFSSFYDSSIEKHFTEAREAAADALAVAPDSKVLDLPTGTGQSLNPLVARLGPEGRIVGVDLSEGMLKKARARVKKNGWPNVHLALGDAQTLTAEQVTQATGAATQIDRLHCFLGMTVFDDMDRAFENLLSLVAPGGRVVVLDTYAEQPSFQGHMVNLIARADIRRRFWAPVEARVDDFEKTELPSKPEHGGALIMCSGRKR